MRLRKIFLAMMMTAAFAAAGMFSAFAETEEEAVTVGWVPNGDSWYYFDANGNPVTGWLKSEEGDGRGNDVWYYMDENGVMVTNQTLNIGGRDYTFGEDGSWVDEKVYQGASRGSLNGTTFSNSWSNIRVTFPMIAYAADAQELKDFEDYYQDEDYASIGMPKLTYDFQVEVDSDGSCLELYYADMSSMADMTPAAFAQAMASIYEKSDYFTIRANASDVTVGGQTYTKISLVNDVDIQKDLYCRKQDQYMVVLTATSEIGHEGSLENALASITTVH